MVSGDTVDPPLAVALLLKQPDSDQVFFSACSLALHSIVPLS